MAPTSQEWARAPRAVTQLSRSGISYDGQVEEVPERIEFAILEDHLLRDLDDEESCQATEICRTAKAAISEPCRHHVDMGRRASKTPTRELLQD